MLLIKPPWTQQEWIGKDSDGPEFDRAFSSYCRAYRRTILQLPKSQLRKVRKHLSRGFEQKEIGAEAFHAIVVRELDDEGYEPTNKLAKLVVLDAFSRSLARKGVKLQNKSLMILSLCREIVPALLMLAVDDHFGLLTTNGSDSLDQSEQPPKNPPFETDEQFR